MTLAVGAASIAGIVLCARWRTSAHPATAAGIFVLFVILQIFAVRVSLLP